MKKSSRYLLLVLGIVVFFVLAPLLILYVTGTRLNFSGESSNSTGILDVKSSPGGATVFVNDSDKGGAPTITRFLNQGDYLVKLTKPGYFDWNKRLPIESGKVTYAQEGVDAVQMIKQSEPVIVTPSGVSSFALVGDTIWFAKNNTIVRASVNNPSEQFTIPLNFTPRSVALLRDKTHLFLSGDTAHAIIDTQSNTAFPIQFTFNANDAAVLNNILLVNIGEILRAYNLSTKTETILRNDVLAFTIFDSTAYFLDDTGTISSGVWDGTSFKDIQPLLSNQSLRLDQSELIITDSKELFLKDSNKVLYRVNQKLEQIASQVESVDLDPFTNELTIWTSSELSFYNFLANKPQLLTRSTVRANDFLIRSDIGYGFVADNNGLSVIEIDTRDQQNRYQIIKNAAVYQIAITQNQKTILALQDGALVMISLRD